jgi:RNA polymerase sigma factor FliA
LRDLDWAPRQQRKRAKLIESAISKLEQQLQRHPTEEEIAGHLEISIEEYQEWLGDARSLTIGSLENAGTEEEGRNLLRYIADSDEAWPSQILERSELERLLAKAIDRMPGIEKTVLSLYYFEELTLREIAQVAGLHESRISQLKTQAIMRLRTYMKRHWPDRRG